MCHWRDVFLFPSRESSASGRYRGRRIRSILRSDRRRYSLGRVSIPYVVVTLVATSASTEISSATEIPSTVGAVSPVGESACR